MQFVLTHQEIMKFLELGLRSKYPQIKITALAFDMAGPPMMVKTLIVTVENEENQVKSREVLNG